MLVVKQYSPRPTGFCSYAIWRDIPLAPIWPIKSRDVQLRGPKIACQKLYWKWSDNIKTLGTILFRWSENQVKNPFSAVFLWSKWVELKPIFTF